MRRLARTLLGEGRRKNLPSLSRNSKESRIMSVIKLEPKTKKPDLMVEYLGNSYVLPGHITAAMMEKMISTQEDGGDEAFLKMFLGDVVPKDFKAVLAQEDLAELAKLWMEHVQGPKDGGSTK